MGSLSHPPLRIQVDDEVEPDVYNDDHMNEMRNRTPSVEPESKLELIPDSTNLYEHMIEGLPLKGERPPFLVVDQEGKVYLGMEAAAGVAGLNEKTIHGLIYEGRIEAMKLSARAKVVHLDSLIDFLGNRRQKPGPPRKTNT